MRQPASAGESISLDAEVEAVLAALFRYYRRASWLALLRALEVVVCRQFASRLEAPVLDLGCGDGFVFRLAFPETPATGIDLSEAGIAKARENGRYQEALVADARRLPFAASSFGGVFSNCAVEHMEEVETVLAEVGRVLRPGGRFLFTVPSPLGDRWAYPVRLLGNRLGGVFQKRYNALQFHLNLFPAEHWRSLLEKPGFEVENVRPYGGRELASYVIKHDFLSKLLLPLPVRWAWRHGALPHRVLFALWWRARGSERIYNQVRKLLAAELAETRSQRVWLCLLARKIAPEEPAAKEHTRE